ncbi:MAG TPA: hypothetical protein VK009_08035 [Chloroflexota bacterium]|nr:hypothetical protein [Chloroflexota bacterium]
MDERRYKRIGITPRLVETLCQQDALILARCVAGLPPGTRFVAVERPVLDTAIWLIVEHASWPVVADGEEIPAFLPEYKQVQSLDELPDWFPAKAGQ